VYAMTRIGQFACHDAAGEAGADNENANGSHVFFVVNSPRWIARRDLKT
jgi:hypothetical protein